MKKVPRNFVTYLEHMKFSINIKGEKNPNCLKKIKTEKIRVVFSKPVKELFTYFEYAYAYSNKNILWMLIFRFLHLPILHIPFSFTLS